MNKRFLISALASAVALAGCNVEVEQGPVGNAPTVNSPTASDVGSTGVATIAGNAQVAFNFELPQAASAAVMQDDTTSIKLTMWSARAGRWSDAKRLMMDGNMDDGMRNHPAGDIEVIETLNRNFDFFVQQVIRNPNSPLVAVDIDSTTPARDLSLPSGNYFIHAEQQNDVGEVYSSAIMLAQLSPGDNDVKLQMLAGEWTFVDESGAPTPLNLDLMTGEYVDWDGDSVADSVVDAQSRLPSGILKGLNIGHNGAGIKPAFDYAQLLVDVDGDTQIVSSGDNIVIGDQFKENEDPMFFFSGVMQEYFQRPTENSTPEHVNRANVIFGGLLKEQEAELFETIDGTEEFVGYQSQSAYFFTAGPESVRFFDEAQFSSEGEENPWQADQYGWVNFECVGGYYPDDGMGDGGFDDGGDGGFKEPVDGGFDDGGVGDQEPTGTLSPEPLEQPISTAKVAFMEGQNCYETLQTSLMRETVTDVDGNLTNEEGKVPEGLIKPAMAVSGNEISGTLIQIIESREEGSEQEPEFIETPNLPDSIRQIRNPFFGQFDDGSRGGGGQDGGEGGGDTQGNGETAVAQAIAAYRAHVSFDGGEQCTTLESLYQHMWSQNYYWDEALQSWEVGAVNHIWEFNEETQMSTAVDLDSIAGDDDNAIEQARAFMPFYSYSSGVEYSINYQGGWVIDVETGEYIEAISVDRFTGVYYGQSETGDEFPAGSAMGPDDVAAASPEGESYECSTNDYENVCFFDSPPVVEGTATLATDGLGTQISAEQPQMGWVNLDQGDYLLLEATIDGETVVFARLDEDEWVETDGVYASESLGITDAVAHGPTVDDYLEGTIMPNQEGGSPHDMWNKTGFACSDLDFNGCYVDGDEWQMRDANDNGVIELVEISNGLASEVWQGGSTTMVCWQDFRMTGQTVNRNVDLPDAYDRLMPITEVAPEAGDLDNSVDDSAITGGNATGGDLEGEPEFSDFDITMLYPESLFPKADEYSEPGIATWDATSYTVVDGMLKPFPAAYDGTAEYIYDAFSVDVTGYQVLTMFLDGEGDPSNETCEGTVDILVENSADSSPITVFGMNDFDGPLRTYIPTGVASVDVSLIASVECEAIDDALPDLSALPIEYELESHTESPLGGIWFFTVERHGDGDMCYDDRDDHMVRLQPGESADIESWLGMSALLELDENGEITGSFNSESGALINVESDARKLSFSPTEIAGGDVDGCYTSLSYNRIPWDEQMYLLQDEFSYDGGFIREDTPETLVIYTYREQDMALFQAINERGFLPGLTIDPVLVSDSYDDVTWGILQSPIEADFIATRTSGWLSERQPFLRSVNLPIDQTVFRPSSLNAVRVEGKPYALPHTIQAQGVIWNTDLLSGEVPTTAEALETVFEEEIELAPMVVAMDDWYLSQVFESVVMAGLVPQQTLKAMAQNQQCYNNANVLAAWELVSSWLEAEYLVPGDYVTDEFDYTMLENEIDYGQMRDLLGNAEAISMIDGSWSLGDTSPIFETNESLSVEMTGLPGAGGKIVAHADGGYAPVRGGDVTAQARFLAFMLTPEYAELVANFVGEVPAGNHGELTIENTAVTGLQAELAENASTVNLGSVPRLNPPYQQGYAQIMQWRLREFLYGNLTAEQFVFEVQNELQFSGLMNFCEFPAVIDPWTDFGFKDPMDPGFEDPGTGGPMDPGFEDPGSLEQIPQ